MATQETDQPAGDTTDSGDTVPSAVEPPVETPVIRGEYTPAHFQAEYDASPSDYLETAPPPSERLADGAARAQRLTALVDERTVDVAPELDEDAFFAHADGSETVVDRYDLEQAVSIPNKRYFEEIERYWVNKPYAFVILFRSRKENEQKYYLIEPYITPTETDLTEFLTDKLRRSIKYSDTTTNTDPETRETVIENETFRLLRRYDLYTGAQLTSDGTTDDPAGLTDRLSQRLGAVDPLAWLPDRVLHTQDAASTADSASDQPTADTALTTYQVRKLLYYLKRDFLGYERIDGIKHDINVEDISCDGYHSPVFVYHTEYEQLITNVSHEQRELDDFVVKLAQRSGKGISKRRPQVDATLPDGSRAQLTLGKEVSDHGTNYTIRQFKDVPFTPIDLINWNTVSLEQMAFFWLAIESNKSILFAGGTASGKTTTLNAVSLFIPSNAKIVSIEDTREVELPQRNWIASVTRPSFTGDEVGDIDEFDLLEAALRQRPDYIIMGEVRGEEGRTLFQIMSTGHTTYTTFHADTVGEVLKRFTTDPINVSKTMFTALDLVSIQTQTRVKGQKVRRIKELTEVNHYDAESDQINVRQIFQWNADTDQFRKMGRSNTLEQIKFDRGWTQEDLETALFKRQVILAYLIDNDLTEYAEVAATIQAFINDPDTVLALIATDELTASLEDLMAMESVQIQIDPEKEALVPRPEPDSDVASLAADILAEAEDSLFEHYRDHDPTSRGLADALAAPTTSEPTPGSSK